MKFQAEHYLAAAQERVEDARRLHGAERYPAAIYSSGVAVESLLHAYRRREDANFKARHDLPSLLKESGIARFIKEADRKKMAGLLGEVWARWKNDVRYASDSRLRAHFKKLKLDRPSKGDFLRDNSRIALNSALEIVGIGARRWHSKKI